MNCQIIQRRLLGIEAPDHPSPEIQAHLDSCGLCREWQTHLLQMEQSVSLLPMPASTGCADFVQRLLESPATVASSPETQTITVEGTELDMPAVVPLPASRLAFPVQRRPLPPTRSWRSQALVGCAAAAVILVVMFGWSALQNTPPARPLAKKAPAADPFVAGLMEINLTLAESTTREQRTVALSKMADHLQIESQQVALVPGGEDLSLDLSRLYDQVFKSLPYRDPSTPRENVAAPSQAADADRLVQLRQNFLLVGALVESGLSLAFIEGQAHLQRANCCNLLAKRLAGEIQQAAQTRQGFRAAEMGKHLHDLLTRGVASNLSYLRQSTPLGSVSERDLNVVGGWVEDITGPLVKQVASLRDTDDRNMKVALDAIQGGQSEVKKALLPPRPVKG